ncbi:UNVERIFIED_CONTAM: hypothetical protein DES50_1187 [Williamsia faeni]
MIAPSRSRSGYGAMELLSVTREPAHTGAVVWKLQCDQCERTFTVAAVKLRLDAEHVAAAHGWSISAPLTLCPACASIRRK